MEIIQFGEELLLCKDGVGIRVELEKASFIFNWDTQHCL